MGSEPICKLLKKKKIILACGIAFSSEPMAWPSLAKKLSKREFVLD